MIDLRRPGSGAPAGSGPSSPRLCLVTGASGYVGGRLALEREARGRVRCLARRPEFVRPRVGAATEVVGGDALDPESLRAALAGVDAAYYLVHSMGVGGRLRERGPRRRRENFAAAPRARPACGASSTSVASASTSRASRRTCAAARRSGGILRRVGRPGVEFRASIVIGSGSLSFEMIRALVERLPVMITPRWVATCSRSRSRSRTCSPTWSRRSTLPLGGEPRLRDRRRRSRLLRRPDARVRAPARPAPAHDPGAGADAAPLEPVARPGDAALRARRPQADREHPQRDGRARRLGARRAFPIRPRGHARGDRAGARARGREFAATRWSDALSSAAERPRSCGGVRFGSGSSTRARVRVPVRAGARLRADPAHRRRAPAGTAATGCGGCAASSTCSSAASACAAAGATPSDAARRRRARLLARRGARARTACCACAPR